MRVVGLLLLICLSGAAAQPVVNADAENVFHIYAASGGQGWFFNGSTTPNPTLSVTIGKTYIISIDVDTRPTLGGNHPFGLSTVATGTDVSELGLVNNGTCANDTIGAYYNSGESNCLLSWTPTATTPQPLYYRCSVHSLMKGSIQVNNATTTAPPTTSAPTNATATPTSPGAATTTAPTTTAPTTTAPTTTAPTTPSPTSAPAAQSINPDPKNVFHITSGSLTQGWFISGTTVANPTLNVTVGTTYYFSIEFDVRPAAGNHPFGLSTVETGTSVSELGLVNNGSCAGTAAGGYINANQNPCVLSWTPTATTPQPLYYRCSVHGAMRGRVQVNAGAGAPTTEAPKKPGAAYGVVPSAAAFVFAAVAAAAMAL